MAKSKKKKKNPTRGKGRRAAHARRRAVKRSTAKRAARRGAVKSYTNPARSGPKNWVSADKVRVRTVKGKKILEIFRKPKRRRR